MSTETYLKIVISHLGAAQAQRAASDDHIIACHIDDAYQAAKSALIACQGTPDLLAALEGVLRVADRATVEFDAARAAIAKATGGQS